MDAAAAIGRQRELLRIEYEEERRAFAEIADRMGVERLADRGRAWMPVRIGAAMYNSLNQRVVEIRREAVAEDAEERDDSEFEHGRQVSLFTVGGDPADRPRRHVAGSVVIVDGDRMVVAVPDGADLAKLSEPGRRAGVMLSFDETTYRAMFDALDRLESSKGRLGELRDLVYSRREAGKLATLPMRFPYLNASQEAGVNEVLRAKDVAIVHGPPGTGKTTTLVEAVHETLRRESQVLVCAQSNMAVDWISEKLVDRGVNVLRIGNPSRVNDKMLSFTYERRFEAHPDYPVLWSIRKALRELRGARRHGTDAWHQKVERLKNRAIELEIRINADIFGSANVIASTLVGSASRLLEGMKFSTVFIDEAAQALEAACWIPMRRAGRMVLAGDHCQLPPTVKSLEAMRGGLCVSLMERIVESHPEAVTLLTTQYRMHPDIMRFPSEYFYGGALRAAPEVTRRDIMGGLDSRIDWIDTSQLDIPQPDSPGDAAGSELEFAEALAGESFGRINRAEALVTMAALELYAERVGRQRIIDEHIDIGIISPYRAQVRYLRQLLRRAPWARPIRRQLSVNTVDGFQGQERDVIFISMVRNNDRGQIGFLRDLRRMNVAMTRARFKLVIIADAPTLTSAHPFYRRLHSYIASLH